MTNADPLGASWDRVAGIYRQALDAHFSSAEYVPPKVTALLGELLSRLSASYFRDEEKFAHDAWSVFERERAKFDGDITREFLYQERIGATSSDEENGRRRPACVEATMETIRRLRDVSTIEKTIGHHSKAALLGGSASYGKFINVRGGNDSSDIDILLVLKQYSAIEEALRDLISLKAFSGQGLISEKQIAHAIERASAFQEFLHETGHTSVFSAKFDVWKDVNDPIIESCNVSTGYTVSFHIFDRETFGKLLLEDYHTINEAKLGTEQVIWDYRETAPSRNDRQRSFGGKSHEATIGHELHEISFARSTKSFFFHSDKYFPGMLQNLVLPVFDVRWGDNDCRRLVDSFRWKLIERLRFELRAHPNELLRLSFAHTRSREFAPHVVRAVDPSTVIG